MQSRRNRAPTSTMPSFIPVDPKSDFSLYNIPFGVFVTGDSSSPHCATILGNKVISLRILSENGKFDPIEGYDKTWLEASNLNAFASQPLSARRQIRSHIQSLFTAGSTNSIETDVDLLSRATFEEDDIKMVLPVKVGDYTDFCASIYHTANAGRLLSVGGPLIPPAWSHLPIGYHGRSSSIIPSNTPVIRPKGLRGPAPGSGETLPSFGPTRALDMEFEMAAIFGGEGNTEGKSLSTGDVEENIFGLVIMNDWSARDHQGYEMFPLGPFNGKNFATTVSPWIVTLDALKPFKTSMPEREESTPLAEYLLETDDKPTFDLPLTMDIKAAEDDEATTVMHSNLRHLSYSFAQLLAHHTVSGCPMNAGDMLGSGTISGPEPDSLACMLEIAERGKKPLTTCGGKQRVWIHDGDRVDMYARAERVTEDGEVANVGFGVCSGMVKPALV